MNQPELLLIGGVPVVALLLVMLVLLRRRKRKASPEGEYEPVDGDVTDLEPADAASGDVELADTEPGDSEPVDAEPAATEFAGAEPATELRDPEPETVDVDLDAVVLSHPEAIDLRSLKAQVRTLEEALERVQTEPATSDSADHVAAAESFRRQVAATLRGLGERTQDGETPERTLARVAAAIERLDAPDDLSRPVLPVVAFDLVGHRMTLAEATGRDRPALTAALVQAPVASTPEPAARFEQTPPTTFEQPPAAQNVEVTTYEQPPVAQAAEVTTFEQQPQPAASAEQAPEVTTFAPGQAPESTPAAQEMDGPAVESAPVAPPEPQIVLPVPPRASPQPERQRRWGRHGADRKAYQ